MEVKSDETCEDSQSDRNHTCIPYRDENDNFIKSRVDLGSIHTRHSILQLTLKIEKYSALALDNLKITDCSVDTATVTTSDETNTRSRPPGILRTNILTSTEAMTTHPVTKASVISTTQETSTSTTTTQAETMKTETLAEMEPEFNSITEPDRLENISQETELLTEIETQPTTTLITGNNRTCLLHQ